jgi:hypothetical protein
MYIRANSITCTQNWSEEPSQLSDRRITSLSPPKVSNGNARANSYPNKAYQRKKNGSKSLNKHSMQFLSHAS